MAALSRLKNVENVFEVTGEFDIVSIVTAPDLEQFRDTLKNGIMKLAGVKSTVTSIILNPQPEILREVPSKVEAEPSHILSE